jgi:putative endonuclease
MIMAFDIELCMEEAKEAFVYMLTNERGNVLYTGFTEDLRERLYLHKKRMIVGFTKKYNVHRLVYFERHPDIASARKRERELKGKSRLKKDLLIKAVNPTFSELDPKIV